MKKIAVVGSGIGGLAFGYYLLKNQNDVQVTYFEKDSHIGGLATTFPIQDDNLEKFYHHIFSTDSYIINAIHDLGLETKLHWYKDNTAIYYENTLYPLTGAKDLLKFTPLPILQRLRMGLILFYLIYLRSWKSLEHITAEEWMNRYAGKKAYEILWQSQLKGKFQSRYADITMSWVQARIATRAKSKGKIGYMSGSFHQLFDVLAENISKKGGVFHTEVAIQEIASDKNNKVHISYIQKDKPKEEVFDRVIITTPAQVYTKFLKGLSEKYISDMTKFDYLSAQTIVLTLSHQLTPYYWISVANTTAPAMVVVEHTNMVKGYNGKHIIYLGNYLDNNADVLKLDIEALKKLYLPFLKEINPSFDPAWVEDMQVFRIPFAQPIVTKEYHDHIPSFDSPVKNVYILNMSQVYPEDRGMNFAMKNAYQLYNHISWTP